MGCVWIFSGTAQWILGRMLAPCKIPSEFAPIVGQEVPTREERRGTQKEGVPGRKRSLEMEKRLGNGEKMAM